MSGARSIAVCVVAIAQGLALATAEGADQVQGKARCESAASPGDTRDIKCALNASGSLQRFRFKAHFSGGHDDTIASMTATLNGVPLTCEEGSKTSLRFEEGNVSLECRFSIAEKAGTDPILGVVLLWSHAQYTEFELDSD